MIVTASFTTPSPSTTLKSLGCFLALMIATAAMTSVEQIKAGEAEFGKVKVFGLEDEGVALMYNDTIVPEQVKAQIEAAETKVTSGEIEVDSAF